MTEPESSVSQNTNIVLCYVDIQHCSYSTIVHLHLYDSKHRTWPNRQSSNVTMLLGSVSVEDRVQRFDCIFIFEIFVTCLATFSRRLLPLPRSHFVKIIRNIPQT